MARHVLWSDRTMPGEKYAELGFLQRWAHDHDIQLKLFNPRQSVRERLEHAKSMQEFDIATLEEMMALLVRSDGRYALAS
jgi:hypothetical protein